MLHKTEHPGYHIIFMPLGAPTRRGMSDCPENSPEGTALSSRGRKPPESGVVSMEPRRGERQSQILSETRLQSVQMNRIDFMSLGASMHRRVSD